MPNTTNLFNNRRFGARVRAELKRQKLSMRRAERIIGVDSSTLCRVTSGYALTVENYLRLLKWLEPEKFEDMFGVEELR
jgi:transcriptional regulator with XRE-family HTH domain